MLFNQFEVTNEEYFLGIDQSISNTGLTLLKKINDYEYKIIESRAVSTPTSLETEDRILRIKQSVYEMISDIDKNNLFISIEGLAYAPGNTNNRAMLFGLFFVLVTSFLENEIKYKIIPPTTLKKIFTGSGKAKKPEMLENTHEIEQITLSELTGIKIKAKKFEDIIDSFALAKVTLQKLI